MTADRIFGYFAGRVKIYADKDNKNALLSFFVKEGVIANVTQDRKNGGVYAMLSESALKKIAPALDKSKIIVYIINIYGIKHLLSGYRKRYGLFVGALLFFALIWASTLFVWRVDVVGTDALSVKEVRKELAEMGVSTGKLISGIDRGSVSDRFLSLHSEISWAALNFSGTTASLCVRETEKTPSPDAEDTNVLVASRDGVVRSVLVYEGSAAVKGGSVVKKGDVLITGFISGSGLQITDVPPLRVGRARGSVMAEVAGTLSVCVPLCETESAEKISEKVCGRRISVFGLTAEFGRTENVYETEERYVTFFGLVEIPVTVTEYREIEISENKRSRSAEEARLEASARVNALVSKELSESEIVSIGIAFTEDSAGVTARADYVYITEIAEKKTVTKISDG